MRQSIATHVHYDKGIDKTDRVRLWEVFVVLGRTFRLDITVDSSATSGWGSLCTWDGMEWKHVHSVPGACLKTPSTLPTRKRRAGVASFKRDRDLLTRVARAVAR